MTDAVRERRGVEISATVDYELYDRFMKLFPFFGAQSFVIRQTLANLCDAAERNPTIVEQIHEATRKMVEDGRSRS